MHYLLTLALKGEPLAIEQVLQTVRYRGFRVNSMDLSLHRGEYQMYIEVYGLTAIENLIQQINKLYDVTSLTFEATASLEQTA